MADIPLRMAVIGVGALGQHHARILSEMDGVELVAVAETRAEIGQQVAARLHTNWVADYHDLLDQVDAVSIVVPTAAHLDVGHVFLRNRVPVLLEKPLALNAEQGKILVKLSETCDTLLQVGHIERFNSVTVAARPLIGTPRYIRAERYSPFPFRSMDIGVVHDLMIHDIDLILDFVRSPVRNVHAFGLSLMGGEEDTAQCHITFENGCIADLSASRISPTIRRHMQVWSDQGCVDLDFGERRLTHVAPTDLLRYGTSPIARALQPGADIPQLKEEVFTSYLKLQQPPILFQDALTAELQDFVDCVRTGRTPIVDGHQGLANLQVAEQILNSLANHQWEGHQAGPTGPRPQPFKPLRKAG